MNTQSSTYVLSWLRLYVKFASILTFGVGLTVLVGWVFGIPAFKSFVPGDRERCLQVGASEYLSKPVSLKLLVKTIETFLVLENRIA